MSWRVGVEFEWLAPKDLSRQTYAQYLAGQHRASVEPFWHPQVEPSKVPGKPLFHNLTQGFVIRNQQGKTIAHTVGDLTIQKQLQRNKPPNPGWFRIVSDDLRLIQLIAQQANTVGTMPEILQPIATLFGTQLSIHMVLQSLWEPLSPESENAFVKWLVVFLRTQRQRISSG